jgi:hypothetical protein
LNVGLNTSVTFTDLDLVPGFSVYYFTVRAYSASSASATITSNGFFVSFDGGVNGKKNKQNNKHFRKYPMHIYFSFTFL